MSFLEIKFLVISNREAESILTSTENLISNIAETSSDSIDQRLNILVNDISYEVIDEQNEIITTSEEFSEIDAQIISARVKNANEIHNFNIEVRRQSE